MTERLIFGLLIILGYFGIGAASAFFNIGNDQRATIRDMLLTVGPILGMIAQAIWKTNSSEQKQADTLNTLANQVASNSSTPVSGTVTFDQGTMTNGNTGQTDSTGAASDPIPDSGAPVGGSTWRNPSPK